MGVANRASKAHPFRQGGHVIDEGPARIAAPASEPRRPRWPLVTACTIAAAVAIGVYLLIDVNSGVAVGYTLLIVLPAALSAFVAWVGSMGRAWRRSTFFLVPAMLTGGMTVIAAVLLREGIICILMILPLWLIFGLLGVWPVYLYRQARNRVDGSVFRANALLLLPLLTLFIDQYVEPPRDHYVVTREIVVDAPVATVWEHLLAIPAIGADEGRWTVSQNLLRLPRPTGATLTGRGVGAVRDAHWQDGIHFQEIVTHWQPGRALAWRFAFPDPSIHQRTDRHIEPHGRQLWVDAGGYRLTPLADGRTRIRLWTRYEAMTPLNGYAAMWGDVILGDIQDNVLAIVAARLARDGAEGPHG